MSAALGLTEEQIAMRRTGIGGSDIPAILGVDPYRGPWNVFAEKLGIAEPVDNRFTNWGKRLERAIAGEYEDRNAAELRPGKTTRHPARAWHLATPDFMCSTSSRHAEPHWGLEIKNKGFYQSAKWGEDGADETTVPEEVRVQCAWGMAVFDLDRWDAATLIGGNDYRQYRLARDLELEGLLVEVGEQFWRDHVLKKEPPPYDGSECAWAHLATRFRPTAKALDAGAEVHELGAAIRAARQLIDAATEGKELHEQRLVAMLIEAGATFTDGGDFRYTVGERKGGPAWKAVAAALAERYKVSPKDLEALAAQHRGPTQMVGRWTDRLVKKETTTP